MGEILIAGAALNQTPFDWENNFNNIVSAIAEARRQGVRILCLPELCITGYGCEDVFLSEWLPAQAIQQLLKIVPYCTDITVCLGLPVRLNGLTYNCATLVSNNNILGFTAKQFLANDGVHYEPRWFTPWPFGEQTSIEVDGRKYAFGDVLYEAEGIKIGFEICEDAWRGKDRPGSRHCKLGVQLIMNPSASHFAFGKTKIREALVLDGSRDFSCSYLYCNLLGNEAGRMVYDGEIMIAQHGRMVQRNDRLSYRNFNVVGTYINFVEPDKTPQVPINPDTHDKNNEFIEALTLALFDYMRKSYSRGYVLSLSGGADSSVCAVAVGEMVKRALHELGLEGFSKKVNFVKTEGLSQLSFAEQCKALTGQLLTCAYQGTKNSSEETLQSAKALALSLGAVFYEWKIDEEVNGFTQKIESVLGRKLDWQTDDIALQNIQARTRSPIIWLMTNIKGALLMATSNRSEGDVGYATMDGDTSGSISPIAGVDKHFIRQWLLWAEKALDYPALTYVNNLTPTAELRPLERVQTDEKDLMPYDLLAEIERLAIHDRLAPIQVYQTLKARSIYEPQALKEYVVKFFVMWSRNQWKRERFAPSFHLDDFNVDSRSWCRFPILSGGFKAELEALKAWQG